MVSVGGWGGGVSLPLSDWVWVFLYSASHMPLSHLVICLSCVCERRLAETGLQETDDLCQGSDTNPFRRRGNDECPGIILKLCEPNSSQPAGCAEQTGWQHRMACRYLRGHASHQPVAVFDCEFDCCDWTEGGCSCCHNLRLSRHAGGPAELMRKRTFEVTGGGWTTQLFHRKIQAVDFTQHTNDGYDLRLMQRHDVFMDISFI